MPTSFSHLVFRLFAFPLLLLQSLQNYYLYFCHCYLYYHTTLLLNILLQILSYPGVVELTTQLLILENILWLPLCRINKFGLNTLPSKVVAIPYTCGLSVAQTRRRVVSDVVDHSGISSGLRVYWREEGEETVNTLKHMHNMAISDARGVLTQCYTLPVKGNNIRESFPCSRRLSDKWIGGDRCHVRYARNVWRTNGSCVWMWLIVLSNFHVENFFIRVAV